VTLGGTRMPNRSGVEVIGASGTIVGGLTSPNEITGNRDDGLVLTNPGPNTAVLGNYIGTTQSGSSGAGNGGNGIVVDGGAGVFIGLLGEQNTINRNVGAGLVLRGGQNHVVVINVIGSSSGPGNAGGGVIVDGGSGHQIGQTTSLFNVIANMDGDFGVWIKDGTGHAVMGNTISGRNRSKDGIRVTGGSGHRIGGDSILRNDISLFTEHGVLLNGLGGNSDTSVIGNMLTQRVRRHRHCGHGRRSGRIEYARI
jgi:hypothetical protein